MLAFGDNYSLTQTMGRYLEPNPPPALILPDLDLQVGVVSRLKSIVQLCLRVVAFYFIIFRVFIFFQI